MLFRITILVLLFTSGWFLNDKYQAGQTLDILGRSLTFKDLSQALWLFSVGLIVANIAKEGEPLFKRIKRFKEIKISKIHRRIQTNQQQSNEK